METFKPSLPGCVRDISIDDQSLDLQQNTDSYRVSLGGCPEQVSVIFYLSINVLDIVVAFYSVSYFIVVTGFISLTLA